jgi:ribosomal protein L7/L12
MAFILNSEAQMVFFKKVFGPSSDVVGKAKALVAAGMKFETAVYTVSSTFQGVKIPLNLTVGVTTLMKESADPAVLKQNKDLITGWIDGLYEKTLGGPYTPATPQQTLAQDGQVDVKVLAIPYQNKIPAMKAIITLTGKSLLEAKKWVEQVQESFGGPMTLQTCPNLAVAGQSYKLLTEAGVDVELVATGTSTPSILHQTMYPPKATQEPQKPTGGVIHLKNAAALGQQVHGTSSGSVYHCIAFSEHVKVAARIYKSGTISIRAEWTDNPTSELKKLEEAGVQLKGQYGSIHFDAGEVPSQRVIGAFLIGTGIAWKQMVTNGADLVITEKQ